MGKIDIHTVEVFDAPTREYESAISVDNSRTKNGISKVGNVGARARAARYDLAWIIYIVSRSSKRVKKREIKRRALCVSSK